ncbi:MAG: divergent polysaccharide deacetylase family protein [Sneathiellales bacterium]|nr:divergent polysaccharide deacetylase family protein [Sneathiellales bacterium]
MAKKTGKPDQEVNKGLFDTVMESPTRLAVFCGAVLMISLAGGMLIGSLLKSDDKSVQVAKEEAEKQDKNQSYSPPVYVQEETPVIRPTERLDNDEGRGQSPVAALDHTPEKEKPVNSGGDERIDGNSLASLPPADQPASYDGDPAWIKYAAKTPKKVEGVPRIAIVIDDVGLNSKRIDALLAVPEILTLAFLPYANNLDQNVARIRSAGHEAMLHLPMEPVGNIADPGPNALFKKNSLAEIRQKTIANLDRFTGYVGVNNHMGSKFTAYPEGMAVVMDVLKERQVLFLDSKTAAKSAGYRLAKERGLPAGIRDIFIDNEIKVPAILRQLEKVEDLAGRKGLAIAIGHPHRETIEALKLWMPQAVKRGYQFVPISAALLPQSSSNTIANQEEKRP